MGFVDGTSVCPPSTIVGSTLCWINNLLTHSVLSIVSTNQNARTTWLALERRYASTSQNRILHLHNELLRTTKGDLSVNDYLDRMNAIIDNLWTDSE